MVVDSLVVVESVVVVVDSEVVGAELVVVVTSAVVVVVSSAPAVERGPENTNPTTSTIRPRNTARRARASRTLPVRSGVTTPSTLVALPWRGGWTNSVQC